MPCGILTYIATRIEKQKTYPCVWTLIVRHAQQTRTCLVHLAWFLCGCRSGGGVGLLGVYLLVAVEGGRTCRIKMVASHSRGRGSGTGSGVEERRWGGAGTFDVGRGEAGELTTSFSQQRQARKCQTAGVGVWPGSNRRYGGRGRV
jgi:hypothetical protein